MRGYSQDVLDEVRARNDIVEVVSQYVTLRPAGKTYKSLCPFHSEKTASFTVSPERQLFHCFGCGAGGDVFTFIMKVENLSFGEAVKLLAERAGVPLSNEEPEEAREARERRNRLYEVNEAACRYFRRILLESDEAGVARAYLKKRGVSEATADEFRLGYALPGWDSALKALTRDGLSVDALLAAGLVIRGKDGRSFYDRFRARLIFPICDASGKVVGFGGRVLDDSVPKYLNSPETAVFAKGRNLYGLHLAKQAIRAESLAVVVEGYMDAVACRGHGFSNVVASLGTALTRDQARLAARYARQVIIAYDADAAGAQAALRGMEILADAGLAVKVATLPQGEDPDSTLRKSGREGLSEALSGARPLVEYKVYLVTSRADRASVDGRVRAAADVARVLAGVKSAVERTEYARRAARELGVPEDALVRDTEALAAAATPRGPVQDRFGSTRHTTEDDIARSGGAARTLEAEKMLLRLMAQDGEVLERVVAEVGFEEFSDERHARIARAIASGKHAESGELAEYAAAVLVGQDEIQGDRMRMAGDCIRAIREHNLRGRIREVERELASLSDAGEMERSRELLAELGSLKSRLSKEFQPFSGTL